MQDDQICYKASHCMTTQISKKSSALTKKARRKYLANGIKYRLSALEGSPLKDSYRKSFFCSKTLIQQGDRLTSMYCNQRWCPTCTAIKTAKFIDAYRHELEAYNDYYFITLTIKSDLINSDNLKDKIGQMLLTWKRINANARKKKQRGELAVWHGMRKIECTYRDNGTFHPHFHLLARTQEASDFIISEWLRHFPDSNRKAQSAVKSSQGVEKELFKYYTKLISGSSKKASKSIDAVALDKVLTAMIGRRVFHNFGTFKKKIDEAEMPELESQQFDIEEAEMKNWEWHKNDWIDEDTGECLTGYEPSESLSNIIYPEGEKSAPPSGGGGGVSVPLIAPS